MRFSIVTCTYNSEKYLRDNLASVRMQTFEDIEHIFIDGFSEDKTVEMIKKYQDSCDYPVKLFQIPPRGISNAMNEGVKKSSGEYIIHLHSDDSFFDKDVLKDIDNFLTQSSEPDWIYGKINVVDGNFRRIGIFPLKKIWQNNYKNKFGKYLLKFYNYIPHQGVFIRKEIFKKYSLFDENINSAMDPDLWLRIRNRTKWFFVDRIISNYSVRDDSQSVSIENRIENINNLKIIQKRHLNIFEYYIARLLNKLLSIKRKY